MLCVIDDADNELGFTVLHRPRGPELKAGLNSAIPVHLECPCVFFKVRAVCGAILHSRVLHDLVSCGYQGLPPNPSFQRTGEKPPAL